MFLFLYTCACVPPLTLSENHRAAVLGAKLEVGNATFRFGSLTMVVCLSIVL